MTSTNATSAIDLPARTGWADWAGMIASIGCAIHCAAMPLVLAYLPTLGLSWLADEGFHLWMAVVCFGFAAAAFVPGWRRHGSFLPALWGAGGLFLLTTAAFAMEGSCCASCASCASEQPVQSGATGILAMISNSSVAGISLTSLVTPMGGVLLVVGHIVNHLKSCGCQGDSCCLSDEQVVQISNSTSESLGD